MSHRFLSFRPFAFALLAASVVAVSGCHWFKKSGPYRLAAQDRPLEVPPDLDRPELAPGSAGVGSAPPTTTAVSAATATAGAADGGLSFVAQGEPEQVFEQVGQALAAVDGVTIVSTAKALGAYDVGYAGSRFVVRVAAQAGGVVVSAVDPRGTAASGPAPAKLIAALKAELGG